MREPKVPAPVAPEEAQRQPRRRRAPREKAPGKLVIVDPEGQKGAEFALSDEVTVGRAPGCGVLLDSDTFVSQLHARLFQRDGQLFVEDLGSTNGTLLNNNKVTAPVAVRGGDKIQFGRTTLEVRK